SIVPRWIILFFDLSITCISFCLALLVKQNLSFTGVIWKEMFDHLLFLTLVNIIVFAAIKTYAGIVRYTGLQDALRILAAITISTVVLFFFNRVSFSVLPAFNFSNVILLVYFTFSFLGLISYRVMVKYAFGYLRNYRMDRMIVMIYGAGEAGIATK